MSIGADQCFRDSLQEGLCFKFDSNRCSSGVCGQPGSHSGSDHMKEVIFKSLRYVKDCLKCGPISNQCLCLVFILYENNSDHLGVPSTRVFRNCASRLCEVSFSTDYLLNKLIPNPIDKRKLTIFTNQSLKKCFDKNISNVIVKHLLPGNYIVQFEKFDCVSGVSSMQDHLELIFQNSHDASLIYEELCQIPHVSVFFRREYYVLKCALKVCDEFSSFINALRNSSSEEVKWSLFNNQFYILYCPTVSETIVEKNMIDFYNNTFSAHQSAMKYKFFLIIKPNVNFLKAFYTLIAKLIFESSL